MNDIVKANKNHRLSLMGLQKQKVKNQYKWKRKKSSLLHEKGYGGVEDGKEEYIL